MVSAEERVIISRWSNHPVMFMFCFGCNAHDCAALFLTLCICTITMTITVSVFTFGLDDFE
jgi:hypothetical protein